MLGEVVPSIPRRSHPCAKTGLRCLMLRRRERRWTGLEPLRRRAQGHAQGDSMDRPLPYVPYRSARPGPGARGPGAPSHPDWVASGFPFRASEQAVLGCRRPEASEASHPSGTPASTGRCCAAREHALQFRGPRISRTPGVRGRAGTLEN